MNSLNRIADIGENPRELLEAAGFVSLESLARTNPEQLLAELSQANAVLRISTELPNLDQLRAWINQAAEISGIAPGQGMASPVPAVTKAVTLDAPAEAIAAPAIKREVTADVVSLVATAPLALPLPARTMVQQQLAVGDIPEAETVSDGMIPDDVRTKRPVPDYRNNKSSGPATGMVKISDKAGQRLEIDTSRLRTTNDPQPLPQRSAKVKVSPSEDRVALLRAPRAETNKGRNPESRFYIRGVLHSHPKSIYAGAFFTLLLMLLTPCAVVSAILLLLSGEMPDRFDWVPGWLIFFPLSLPLIGLAYLIWGLGGSCRICGQGLFRHSSHLKNSRAHRLPILGYIFPLCFHLLIFHWFRCTHCGTPVRLKE